MKKYEFTGEIMVHEGITLRRIRRISDNLIGGWIESEENLSQKGDCFIFDNAKVYGNAKVSGNASVFSNAKIYGNAIIRQNARVYGDVTVYNNAVVCENAEVYNNAKVYGDAVVYGDARVYESAKVYDNAIIRQNARVYGDVTVYNYAEVCNNARVYGNAILYKGIHIGEVVVKHDKVLYIQCAQRMMTLYSKEGIIYCNIGCQKGMTYKDLLRRIEEDGGMSPHRQEYVNIMEASKILLR